MDIYLSRILLTWIPLLALTLILLVHRKALVPIFTGLFEAIFNVGCMDGRVMEDLERGEVWRLPGGAYAFSIPVIWTAAVTIFLALDLTALAWFFAIFAVYQIYFTSPMIIIGLIKGFLVGLFTDEETAWLEMHKHVCKAIAVTDPFAAVLTLVYIAKKNSPRVGTIIDEITAMHWVDVLPFTVALYLVVNFGRAIRKAAGSDAPWMKINLGWSEIMWHMVSTPNDGSKLAREKKMIIYTFLAFLAAQTAAVSISTFCLNIGQGIVFALFGVVMGWVFLSAPIIVFSLFETAIFIGVMGIVVEVYRLIKRILGRSGM